MIIRVFPDNKIEITLDLAVKKMDTISIIMSQGGFFTTESTGFLLSLLIF